MIDAANRMGRLIDDLLAFSRMGRASLTPRRSISPQLVREAQAEVPPDTAGREIVWDIQPLPSVYADPALLRPVLVNLLSNAVKYTGTRDRRARRGRRRRQAETARSSSSSATTASAST